MRLFLRPKQVLAVLAKSIQCVFVCLLFLSEQALSDLAEKAAVPYIVRKDKLIEMPHFFDERTSEHLSRIAITVIDDKKKKRIDEFLRDRRESFHKAGINAEFSPAQCYEKGCYFSMASLDRLGIAKATEAITMEKEFMLIRGGKYRSKPVMEKGYYYTVWVFFN